MYPWILGRKKREKIQIHVCSPDKVRSMVYLTLFRILRSITGEKYLAKGGP